MVVIPVVEEATQQQVQQSHQQLLLQTKPIPTIGMIRMKGWRDHLEVSSSFSLIWLHNPQTR